MEPRETLGSKTLAFGLEEKNTQVQKDSVRKVRRSCKQQQRLTTNSSKTQRRTSPRCDLACARSASVRLILLSMQNGMRSKKEALEKAV